MTSSVSVRADVIPASCRYLYDSAANMVLEHTLERHVAGGKYCDIPLGIYMVKGDTVVLTAELVSDTQTAC